MRYEYIFRLIIVVSCIVFGVRSIELFAQQSGEANTIDSEKNSEIIEIRKEIDAEAQIALERLFETNERAQELYEKASGYAVFQGTKAGLILTGGGGTGVAVNKETDERTYMRMGSGGVGLGVGLQSLRLIILFESEVVLQEFVDDGGWDSSVSAQAAAGKSGKNFASSFVDGIAVFQLTDKGLMAQADLTSTRFWISEKLNQ